MLRDPLAGFARVAPALETALRLLRQAGFFRQPVN